jgi:hypothetical protein
MAVLANLPPVSRLLMGLESCPKFKFFGIKAIWLLQFQGI